MSRTDGRSKISLFLTSAVSLNTIRYEKNAANDDHITAIISNIVHIHTGGWNIIINAAKGINGVTE